MRNLIDVNNNTALTGSLAAEINQYRRELRQKDELIKELSTTQPVTHVSYNPQPATVRFRDPYTDPYYSHGNLNRISGNHYHSHYTENIPPGSAPAVTTGQIHHHVHTQPSAEVRTTTTVNPAVAGEANTAEIEKTRRDLYDTRLLLEREFDERKLLESRDRNLGSVEIRDLEISNAKSKLLIDRLQAENNQKSDRIIDLEGRVKTILEEKETHVSSDISVRNILSDGLIRLAGSLSQATPNFPEDFEEYRTKCKETVDELVTAGNELSRELILAKASLAQAEAELAKKDEAKDTHNGTIQQLCEELAESKKNLADKESELKQVTADKDSLDIQIEAKDKEIEVLRERLDNQIAVYDTLKGQQEDAKSSDAEREAEFRKLQYEKRVAETELRTTLESLAHSLCDPEAEIDPAEIYNDKTSIAVIKDKIMKTVSSHREKSTAVTLLEKKVSELTDQLEKQCELHAETLKRAKQHEFHNDSDKLRIKHLETELASQDVLRETYQTSKEKYIHFLNSISNLVGMTELGNNLGLDLSTMDMLLERIKQLVNGETGELASKQSNLYLIQKRNKELKKQVENKDMHIDLLRKKLIALDEQNVTRESLYIDRDDAVKTAKKMEKRLYRLENDLGAEKTDNFRLKAELAELRTLQLRVSELERELDEKDAKLSKVEGKAFRQGHKLKTLKHDLNMTEADSQDVTRKLKDDLRSTKYDLKQTKMSLDEINRQKKALNNFRSVIGKMLGLEVSNLNVPDFEIISRLEKLIQTHHVNQASLARPVVSQPAAMPMVGTFTGSLANTQANPIPQTYARPTATAYTPSRRYRRPRAPTDDSSLPIYDSVDIIPTNSRTRRYRSASPTRRMRY